MPVTITAIIKSIKALFIKTILKRFPPLFNKDYYKLTNYFILNKLTKNKQNNIFYKSDY